MESLGQIVDRMKLRDEQNLLDEEALTQELIENNTERLFHATIRVDKAPYVCPVCGVTCLYKIEPVFKDKIYYYRQGCKCELEAEAVIQKQIEQNELDREIAQARRGSRLIGKLARMTFKSLEQKSGLTNAVKAAQDYARGWPQTRGLIFSGPFGSGKTHVACALANALIAQGVKVEFWPGFEILQEIRDSYDRHRDNEDICDTLSQIAALIYDDIGNERISSDEKGDWAREQLLRIFYWRDIRELPVIATTNLTIDELIDKIGGATVSRLLGMCEWVEITATDYRTREVQDAGDTD